ncbi:MAG: purine-nucleoside phosphorylase [Sphaerochaetaceae bacterium]|jgi:purine-nucleoside phosphorylase|nr:purine-nucleoside phosphorylase [Sphaerochaetaceae bacterium]NLY08050.1 purine-nucleoside phosphorylase [Spirochaetales bacterium]
MSIHIAAKEGQVASTVLLPGDPLRAKFIAENFLDEIVCYSEVRGMYGFTGTYNGIPVSVQGTGMGGPSISIYANELIRYHGAKNLIRVGTAGSTSEKYPLGHVVLAQAACSDGGINSQRFGSLQFAPVASFDLLSQASARAAQLGMDFSIGSVFSSDQFYDEKGTRKCELMKEYGVCAVEMETCELYTLAAFHGVRALSVVTISDLMYGNFESDSSIARQTAYTNMIHLALELA